MANISLHSNGHMSTPSLNQEVASVSLHQSKLDIHIDLDFVQSKEIAAVEHERRSLPTDLDLSQENYPQAHVPINSTVPPMIDTTCADDPSTMEVPSCETSDSIILQQMKAILEKESSTLDLAKLSHLCQEVGVQGHLAVLTQPYLDRIIVGKKTIESRFSKVRGLPFQHVKPGDILLLKEAAGPILAIGQVGDTLFFGPLSPGEAIHIMDRYCNELQLDPPFREAKRDSAYVSLVTLEQVIVVSPRSVAKADRRAWVVLDDSSNQAPQGTSIHKQISFLQENSECVQGFHRYYDSKQVNGEGNPICRYCGTDVIPWSRVHQRDLNDIEHTIMQLRTEGFRESWWTKNIDVLAQNHALRKGKIGLQESARTRLWRSVGVVFDMPDGTKRPYRDGVQTPYSGNIIYYAQHALACCCRKCIRYWHGVPMGRDLTEQEIEYFVELVMRYISERLPELQKHGVVVPRQRRT